MPRPYGQLCPIARSLDLLGDRWTLLIIRDLFRGRRRFQDLLDAQPGLAPNVLSDRLKLLEEHGIVTRRFYSEHPPRAEYLLTQKGRDLDVVVGALASWGARHAGSPVTPLHTACGHPVEVLYRCQHCADQVSYDAVEMRRDPAASAGPRSVSPRSSSD